MDDLSLNALIRVRAAAPHARHAWDRGCPRTAAEMIRRAGGYLLFGGDGCVYAIPNEWAGYPSYREGDEIEIAPILLTGDAAWTVGDGWVPPRIAW